jgi:hypothetical protein
MDEVSMKATLTDSAGFGSGLTVTVPRSEVEDALHAEDGEAELLLDVVRATNGHKEERRISVAWDRDALKRLASETSGDGVTLAIDPAPLQAAFDTDVEAHGLREVGATFAIVVATAGAAAGASAGSIDPSGGAPLSGSSDQAYSAIEQVRADTTPAADSAAAIDNVRACWEAPPPAPDSYAGIENVRGTTASEPSSAIENVRAGREAPSAAPDSSAAIENVRAGGSAIPDSSSAIENVRADRTVPDTGGGGISISAPSPTESAALAGAAALTIAGAAFALRRKREPGIA